MPLSKRQRETLAHHAIRPGEIRNPEGRNQWTARRAFEQAVQSLLAEETEGGRTRGERLAEHALQLAEGGNERLLVEVLKRLWPPVQ